MEAVESAIAALPECPDPLSTDDGKLRGRAIREVAVAILAADRGAAPIHYRDWLRLVEAEGHQVGGRRPDAVFHNQITRHPAVHATTSRGFYSLDLDKLATDPTAAGGR